LAGVGAACLLTILNEYTGQLVPIPSTANLATHLVSIVYLGLLLLALMRAAQAAARLAVSPGFQIAAGFALALPVFVSIFSGVGAASLPAFAALGGILDALPYSVRFFTSNLLGPLGMILLGTGFGRLFRHPNTLLAGAGFAIFFDIVVVTMGTVSQLLKQGSNVISMVSVGSNGGSGSHPAALHGHAIMPLSGVTIGPADVLFIGVFLSAVRALRLSPRATFAWMFLLLFSALCLVETTALPIPALAPMGIAVLIANARFAAFTRTERRDLGIGAVFALFCAVLIIGGARRLLPTPPPRYGFLMGHLRPGGPLLVLRLKRDSLAARAGLRPGDEIVAIDDLPAPKLNDETMTRELVKTAETGLRVRVRRAGNAAPLDLVLR
jgi:hypothetical protein